MVWTGSRSFAARDWRFGIDAGGGLIQQPSSQYFLIGYSGSALFTHTKTGAGLALTGVTREPFKSGEHVEQDYGATIEFRKQVAKWRSIQIGAGLGFGEMRGYIKRTGDTPQRSDYRMRGITTTLEVSWVPPKASGMNAFVNHTLFTGFSTRPQSEARVAWPWSIAMAGVGCEK